MTSPSPDGPFGRWIVDRMPPEAGGAPSTPIAGTTIVVEFAASGSVAGDAGCNVFRGSFEVDDDSITIGRLATTQKLCGRPEGVMEQEARFLATLARASRFTVDADTLLLLDDTATPVMSMTRASQATS